MPEGSQRVGALVHVPDVLRGLGVEPGEVLAACGLAPDAIVDPEGQIPFTTASRLVHVAAGRSGCPHFGLLVGQRNASESLGLVGLLMRNAPTWGRAILDLAENQRRYVRGAVPYVMEREGVAWSGYCVYQRNAEGAEHMEDGAIAIGFNLMRELCGARPSEVWLARREPADPRPYHAFFGVRVRFDSSHSALVFPSEVLRHKVRTADPALRAALEERVRTYWAVDTPKMSDRVVRLLRSRILFHDIQVQTIAAALSIHPRFLERALKEEGTTYRELLLQSRVEVAQRLLTGTRLSVTEIGTALGYSDTSAFSNAFRRVAGVPPSAWRASTPAERSAQAR